MEERKPGRRKFRPSEFMRARRPYLFSDTEVSEEAQLDRSTFEYHLGTLTARKQELDFEHFARKLVEKEICPNLRPQTGPTGGGDSKADAETYPVSNEISERWYYADAEGQKGASERWAFAFSTKEDWRTKVREDIKGIASTKRPYTVAYFVTSQFARDKDRASLEDELRGLRGIDVKILDKTWIVDKVFSNRRQKLAIETLKLTIPLTPAAKKGPRDTSREAELDELEQQITDPERYRGVGYQLVEDALQAALLARGLERPRVEVDGRFDRASRLAEERGTRQQQLRCAYNKAWTHFWWYDDFNSFNRIYDTVEKLAQGSQQTSDLELLENLWQLLYASVSNGHIAPNEARLDERTILLERDLAQIQKDQSRPSAALYATASLLLIDLLKSLGNSEGLKRVLKEFRHVFEESKGLIDFPALQFAKILMELGEYFAEDKTFDEAFESALSVTRDRESSAASGRMLLRRGTQKLKAKRPYEAIRLLGRAQQDLALHESRGEMAAALALCASAYEAAGLLWAARANMLLAASQALKEFWEQGQFTVQAVACVRRMIWLELQLGRIPGALAWINTFLVLDSVLSSALGPDEERERRLQEEWASIDGVLGVLLLRTDTFDLKDLDFLPSVLERLHLDFSWMALLYALGHENRLRSEKVIPAEETPEAVLAFFNKWVEQPMTGELPAAPEFLHTQTLELRSTILGCKVTAKLSNNDTSLFLAEAILAGLEAFLATSLDSPLVPHTPSLQLRIVQHDFMTEPIEFNIRTAPRTAIEISHAGEYSSAADSSTQDKFVELISTIAGHITVLPEEGQNFLESLIKDERGLGRALLISNVRTMMTNVLGDNPKIRISDWRPKKTQDEAFPLLRKGAWLDRTPKSAQEPKTEPLKFGKGEPPAELLDVESLKHTDRSVVSLINLNLWDKAAWTGTGFATSEHPSALPILALIFKNREPAAEIFAAWQSELGRSDSKEKLRVSIITGVSTNNPAAYRVVIGSNPNSLPPERSKHLIFVYRINRMDPTSSANLDRFLQSYQKSRKYSLVPAHWGPDNTPVFEPQLGILKRELHVRPAWQVARHDPDSCAIDAQDKVIIPEEISAPPVLEVLAWKQAKEAKTPSGSFRGVSGTRSRTKKPGRNDPCYCGSGKKYKKCHGR